MRYIEEYINNIIINIGQSIRTDCPSCNNSKTLSITRFIDCTKYYCFHADCTKSGVIKEGVSYSSFSTTDSSDLNKKHDIVLATEFWRKNNLPVEFYSYIMENNCLYAYDHNLADIRYDFKKHRAVFCIKDKTNKIVDAAGRSLLSNVKPKWYRYGRSRQPFICGDNKVAVVVEDCASAASICSFATGVALLGTTITEETCNKLKEYNNIIVALDKDATMKSLPIMDKLKWYSSVRMVPLTRDLKKLETNDAKEVLNL